MMGTRVRVGLFGLFVIVILRASAHEANLEDHGLTSESTHPTIVTNTQLPKTVLLKTSVKKDAPKEYNSTFFKEEVTNSDDESHDELLLARLNPEKPELNNEAKEQIEKDTPVDELDARSAFVNNQFVPDEPTSQTDATPPALYKLLQQQMEHVLASTGSDFSIYSLDKYEDSSEQQSKNSDDNLQLPPSKPLFALDTDDDNSSDYADETEAETDLYSDFDKAENNVLTENYNKEVEEVSSYGTKLTPELPNSTVPTRKPLVPYEIPTAQSTLSGLAYAKPALLKPTTGFIIQHQNGTVHQHKRRITFKTVATASQFVSTPLADLMFKYTIGIAEPKSKTVNDITDQYKILPKRTRRNNF